MEVHEYEQVHFQVQEQEQVHKLEQVQMQVQLPLKVQGQVQVKVQVQGQVKVQVQEQEVPVNIHRVLCGEDAVLVLPCCVNHVKLKLLVGQQVKRQRAGGRGQEKGQQVHGD